MGVCNLMLVAGVDTTWSSIGASLWHLAQHPEHRQQLRDDPELWPAAVEELLRAYAPVTMARIVDRDIDFQGCPMKAGDRVLMSFPAANRDPEQFENPNEVIFDREHNRHVAFGAGIHRCAGSNLAARVACGVADLAGAHPGVRAGRPEHRHLGRWPSARHAHREGEVLSRASAARC